jgi:tripartite ATP-independent transporter DctM subunit
MAVEHVLIILMFVTFIAALFTGFPVAFVLGGIGVLFTGVGYLSDMYLDTLTGLDYMMLGLTVNRIFKYMDNWVLVALPMFIFMGLMLDRSGIAERMMEAIQELFGPVRGGLAVTVTAIGIILAASTGIIGASVVLLGMLSLPAMMRQGYARPLALGTIAGSGTLGILIPPSVMLVIMADQLALSVGDLFMAALFPGIILGMMYMGYILVYCMIRPSAAPVPEGAKRPDFKIVRKVVLTVLPAAGLILAVLGSIFAGITTPTEASGVGAMGAILLAIYNRKLNLRTFKEVLYGTYNTTAYIFAIFLGASVFALTLRGLGGDEYIEDMLTGLPFGPYGILACILGAVFLLGFFLDWIEITLIILPLVAPVVGKLGLEINGYGDPELVWFVLLVAVALQTSFLTPPVGFALFYLKGVCPPGVELVDIYKGVVPFIIFQLIGLGLVVLFPALVTWLPALAYR